MEQSYQGANTKSRPPTQDEGDGGGGWTASGLGHVQAKQRSVACGRGWVGNVMVEKNALW